MTLPEMLGQIKGMKWHEVLGQIDEKEILREYGEKRQRARIEKIKKRKNLIYRLTAVIKEHGRTALYAASILFSGFLSAGSLHEGIINPGSNLIRTVKSGYHTHQCINQYQNRMFENSIESCIAAINDDQENAVAHSYLCEGYIAAEKNYDAIRECTAAIRSSPSDPKPYVSRGAANIQINDLDAAESDLRKAIEIDGSFQNAYVDLGLVLHKKGDLNGAMECYAKAIEIKPSLPLAHNNLGILYLDIGKLKDAEAEFRTALKYDPDFDLAKENLENLMKDKKS